MRTIKIFFYLLAAVALTGLVSCQPEEDFKPGKPDNAQCVGVYFPKQKVTEEQQIFSPTDVKHDSIEICRSDYEDSLVISLKLGLSYLDSKGASQKADSNFFKVSDVEFEAGQQSTWVHLDFEDAVEGVAYTLHLTVDGEEYASNYSSNFKTCDYKVLCVKYIDFVSPKDTTKPATVHFYQGFWQEEHYAKVKYYEVDGIRHCITYDEHAVPGTGSTPNGGFFGQDPDVHFEFDWYVKDEEECDCDESPHSLKIPEGYDAPAGAEMICVKPTALLDYFGTYHFYLYDYWNYYVDNKGYGRGFAHFINANSLFDNVSYYDGNGGFFFWIYGWTSAQDGWVGYWAEDYDVYGIAEGFNRADYTLELSAGMTQADSNGDNVVPVAFDLGADVDKVGYTISKGKLSGAQVTKEAAAIAKDTIDYSYAHFVDAQGASFSDSVAVAETGIYTLVAVGLDTAKKAKATASVSFRYLATGEANEVILSVSAEGTAKYESQGYSPITSLSYTISGAGIIGAIPLLYTETQVAKEGGIDALIADIESDPNNFYSVLQDEELASQYALSASALADVNDKGYTDIADNLSANTTYYVIVWATNGYAAAAKYAVHTTDGLPNEIIKKGTGTYTYSLFFTDEDGEGNAIPHDDEGLNLEYNPNTKLYEIPNWGYGVSFAFNKQQDDSLTVPLQFTGYTDATYGDVYVTDYSHLDATLGAGFCAYFGIDPNKKGYVDADGYYHFEVAYIVSAGSFGDGEEIFYPDGKPAAAPAPAPGRKISSKYQITIPKVDMSKKNGNFLHIKGVKGLKASESVVRVKASHNVSSVTPKAKVTRDNCTFTYAKTRKVK